MLIAHRVNRSSGNEEMVVSFRGTNYKFTSYCKNQSWNHKRQTRISAQRWISRNSISVHFVYKTVKVKPEYVINIRKELVLKILSHYQGYD
jgi:hypothetical protein